MSHPNLERRRNRTLSVELLESRLVLHKTIMGTIHGTLLGFTPGPGIIAQASFACNEGTLKHFNAKPLFSGSVDYRVSGTNGKDITFMATAGGSSSLPDLRDDNNQANFYVVDFTGTGKVTNTTKLHATFTWDGTLVGAAGDFSGAAHGTAFHAHGTLSGNTHKISVTLSLHIHGKA
jgi:hypothetical protein